MTSGIQVTLQQQDGREFVNRLRAFLDTDTAFSQHSSRLHTRKTLVQKLCGQTRTLRKTVGKLFRVLTLPALIAAHVKRLPDQQQFHLMLLTQGCQMVKVFTNARAVQCRQTLRRDAEGVAESESDAFLAHVERENAAVHVSQSSPARLTFRVRATRYVE